MPRNDGTGPASNSQGPRDGRGQGRGRSSGSGAGRRSGGQQGNCKSDDDYFWMTDLKQEMDVWVKDFQHRLQILEKAVFQLQRDSSVIDHNYELILELKKRIDKISFSVHNILQYNDLMFKLLKNKRVIEWTSQYSDQLKTYMKKVTGIE